MQWPSANTRKHMAASIKEFKHQVRNNPSLYYGFFGALAVETAALCYVNPWLSFAVNGLGMGSLTALMIFGQAMEGQRRKHEYDYDVYANIKLGRDETVRQLASKTHYQEDSLEVLKEQNTTYLYEALNSYNDRSECNMRQASHYLRAAEIFLAHHADSDAVIERLKRNSPSNVKGVQWLEMHQKKHKVKLP